MMILRLAAAAILLCICTLASAEKHNEKWYQTKFCEGVTEFVLEDKTRVDCLTKYHAIEFDWGHKWAECAGQAQYYARMTNTIAGCVLINPLPRFLKRLMIGFDGAIWIVNDKEIERIR